ncbi:signal peptidase I [Extensimonas vulgaris]|uniref:Signal peptidase I n=1 Tax=Extensimonas vulgaris TaxID=1031594 RepID=A0A369AN48_9BURK|nr:signal peptidase I [Extensimonas vulgaris]RCX09748.1 signal peptidase I [Extensimonas vulgaris]TWI39378.1 signal peptidase I [Extensimonas vulgaris]TXD15624.1 signal peptidase I [Extensimonas vulgaris]
MPFMQTLTALVLAAFAGYMGAWYFGALEGDFELLLFLATVVTAAYWLAERFYFLPRRRRAAQAVAAAAAQRRTELDRLGIEKVDLDVEEAQQKLLRQPWWLDWTAGLFPVIAAVFLLRSFLFEPFKIPSGSMIPTLLVGDLILVNKFTYGVRLPVIHTRLTQGAPLQRGDVVVFRYPPKPSVDYIKRVVGVPGDEVAYLNKRLTINGKPVKTVPLPDFFDADAMRYFPQFEEYLGARPHRMLNNPEVPAFVQGASQFAYRDNCRYSIEGVVCKVPAGHYFMMGDNRDNSLDSRYWGFVPEANIVGKAVLIWMNFSNPKRVGTFD